MFALLLLLYRVRAALFCLLLCANRVGRHVALVQIERFALEGAGEDANGVEDEAGADLVELDLSLDCLSIPKDLVVAEPDAVVQVREGEGVINERLALCVSVWRGKGLQADQKNIQIDQVCPYLREHLLEQLEMRLSVERLIKDQQRTAPLQGIP